jgi:hypothetical protein
LIISFDRISFSGEPKRVSDSFFPGLMGLSPGLGGGFGDEPWPKETDATAKINAATNRDCVRHNQYRLICTVDITFSLRNRN